MNPIHSKLQLPIQRLATGAVFASAFASSAFALDLAGVSIHGSASTTASYSPEYNYLGKTRDRLDLNQTELILNGAYRWDCGLKVAAQIYAYRLDGYDDITLDFANVDYSFCEAFGVRVGRNKLPLGFYNDVQDLDQVRVFASLPLNFYPRAVRPFNALYDGGACYGTLRAGALGTFDYQLFAGTVPKLDEEMPFMRGVRSQYLDVGATYGASLVWNTAVDGLRVGYTVQTATEIEARSAPADLAIDYKPQTFSIEYSWGKWVATAEFKYVRNDRLMRFPPVPPFPPFPVALSDIERQAYLQLTYAATDKLGLGVYYAYADFGSLGIDRDLAFATCYAIKPWWLVKGEVHLMNGISNLGNAGDANPGASDTSWSYFVLKTTLSF